MAWVKGIPRGGPRMRSRQREKYKYRCIRRILSLAMELLWSADGSVMFSVMLLFLQSLCLLFFGVLWISRDQQFRVFSPWICCMADTLLDSRDIELLWLLAFLSCMLTLTLAFLCLQHIFYLEAAIDDWDILPSNRLDGEWRNNVARTPTGSSGNLVRNAAPILRAKTFVVQRKGEERVLIRCADLNWTVDGNLPSWTQSGSRAQAGTADSTSKRKRWNSGGSADSGQTVDCGLPSWARLGSRPECSTADSTSKRKRWNSGGSADSGQTVDCGLPNWARSGCRPEGSTAGSKPIRKRWNCDRSAATSQNDDCGLPNWARSGRRPIPWRY